MPNQFGQVGVAIVATAAVNAAVGVHHAVETKSLQRKFGRRLSKDEINTDYIKNILLRLRSLGTRLVHTKEIQPGTQKFEDSLKKAIINEMIYKGYCNADIYVPMGPNDRAGSPRGIIGSFTRSGHVKSKILPPDTGPMWATGCKNAQDNFRYTFVNKYKGKKQFKRLMYHKEDIGVTGLLLRYGSGLFIAAVLLLAIRVQSKVIKQQKSSSAPAT